MIWSVIAEVGSLNVDVVSLSYFYVFVCLQLHVSNKEEDEEGVEEEEEEEEEEVGFFCSVFAQP